MIDFKKDPKRRCMPVAEWPALDHQAWEIATKDGGLFDDQGPAAHWKPKTKMTVEKGYGRYLTFVDRHGWLDRDVGPEQRLSKPWLRAYHEELVETVAPVTVEQRFRSLTEAVRVMVPHVELAHLYRARRRLKARARPTRNKRMQLEDAAAIFHLGLALTEQAESGDFQRELWRACTYRDGICIMLLICRPIRRANLAAMRLDQHLVKVGDAYMISLDETETKNHRPYDRPLDACLTPYIERYLVHYRRLLLGERQDDHVWISWRGIPMSEENLYGRIVKHTCDAFGHPIPLHRFRDCAITSLGEDCPEKVWLGMYLLHHSDPRTAERHYNQALAHHAVQDYQRTVLRRRRQLGAVRRRSAT